MTVSLLYATSEIGGDSAAAADLSVAQRSSRVKVNVFTDVNAQSLIDMSRGAAMLVVGGGHRQHLPAAYSRLITHSKCPVVVVHDDDQARTKRPILVGIEGSSVSEPAVSIAFDQASRHGVELIAVHGWTEPGALGLPSVNWAPIEWANFRVREKEVLAERLAGHRDQYPDVLIRPIVVCDNIVDELRKHAQFAQLVVVGGRFEHGLLLRSLGTVAQTLLNQTDAPVLIARESLASR